MLADFCQRAVRVLADEFIETFQERAGEGGRMAWTRKGCNGSRGLSLHQEFLNESETDRESLCNLLTRPFSSIISVENSLPQVD